MKTGDIVAIIDDIGDGKVVVRGPFRLTNVAKVDWKHKDKALYQTDVMVEMLAENDKDFIFAPRRNVTTIIDAEFVEKTGHIVVTKSVLPEPTYVSRTE